jgi:hypothetical protein
MLGHILWYMSCIACSVKLVDGEDAEYNIVAANVAQHILMNASDENCNSKVWFKWRKLEWYVMPSICLS